MTENMLAKLEKPALTSKKFVGFLVAVGTAFVALSLSEALRYAGHAPDVWVERILAGGLVVVGLVYVGGVAALETITHAVIGSRKD